MSVRRTRPRIRRLLGATIVIAVVIGAHAPTSAHSREPDAVTEAKKLAATGLAGANDWNCAPTAQRPEPVVLVHGLFVTAETNWPFISPRLADAGFCVFALNYGNYGTRPMQESAKELAVFVAGVRAATGAEKVDLVGHSQGGVMPRWYLRFEDGARHVDDFVALAPPSHGSRVNLFELLPPDLSDLLCESCLQFSEGSEFLTELNREREVEPGVEYTTISTRYDQAVVPYTNAYLQGPAEQVTNVLLQDACPLHVSFHASIASSALTRQWIRNALERSGPADPRLRPNCAVI